MRRRQRRAWLDGWDAVADERVHHVALLDEDERGRLGELVEWLVRTRHFEAAQGFALTQEMVITIATTAALVVLELGRDAYRDVRAIIVHPRTIVERSIRGTRAAGVVTDRPRHVLGHTNDRHGPVVLAWDAVYHDARHPDRGRNVVIHEFAHKVDLTDGRFDGTPSFDERADRSEWIDVCTREYRRLRRREQPDPVLDDYGTTNPSEFFAVATESFFVLPLALREHHPQLYDVLRRYYGQDPAARAERVVGPG